MGNALEREDFFAIVVNRALTVVELNRLEELNASVISCVRLSQCIYLSSSILIYAIASDHNEV